MKRLRRWLSRVRAAAVVLRDGPVNVANVDQAGYVRGYEKGFERGRDTMYRELVARASALVSPAWASSGSVKVHHGTRLLTVPLPGKNMSRTARTASCPALWVNRWRPATSPAA